MKSDLVSAPSGDPKALKSKPNEQDLREETKPVVPTTEALDAIQEAQMDHQRRILAEGMEASLVEALAYVLSPLELVPIQLTVCMTVTTLIFHFQIIFMTTFLFNINNVDFDTRIRL